MATPERQSNPNAAPSPEALENKPEVAYGISVGKLTLTNEDIHLLKAPTRNGTLTAEGIKHLLWIDQRYVADENQDAVSMGIDAAKKALGNWHDTVDVLIVSTSYPTGKDISLQIQEGLGIPCRKREIIHAACSGSGAAFTHINENEAEFQGANVLLVATDTHQRKTQALENNIDNDGNLIDPGLSRCIFSDVTAACGFKYGKGIKMLGSLVHRFPKEVADLIKIPYDPRLLTGPVLEKVGGYRLDGPTSTLGIIEQKGSEVLSLLQETIPQKVKELLNTTGLSLSDIDLIIPHQASGKVIGTVALALGTYVDPSPPLGPEFNSNKKYVRSRDIDLNLPAVFNDVIDGNSSSASGIKAEMEAIRTGRIKKGSKVLHIDFGWGLTLVLGIKEFG